MLEPFMFIYKLHVLDSASDKKKKSKGRIQIGKQGGKRPLFIDGMVIFRNQPLLPLPESRNKKC